MGMHWALEKAGIEHEIIGVDVNPQPRYPFMFIRMDWRDFLSLHLEAFDFFWASPPRQKYSAATRHLAKDKPKFVEAVRACISNRPYCIENTPGAPLENPVTLCGLSFGLNVKRHRLFETNFPVKPVPCVPGHPGNWYVIFGHECRDRRHGHAAGRKNKLDVGRKAMGIDWMTRGELSEAIPPAYSEYILSQWLAQR